MSENTRNSRRGGRRLRRHLLVVAGATAAAGVAGITSPRASADTVNHLYVVQGVQPLNPTYAEQWTAAEYTSLRSECAPEYTWGGWWPCDAGRDYAGVPRAGLDLHQTPTDVGNLPVWFKGYQSTPSVGAYGEVSPYFGCSKGVKVVLKTSAGVPFFEGGYVHVVDPPVDGTRLPLYSGWNDYRIGWVHTGGDCATPVHLHQDGSPSASNRAPTSACNATAPNARCDYPNPWSGSPPLNYLFDAVWTSASPPPLPTPTPPPVPASGK
ncbi:MAG: hypothetical protein ACYDEB_12305 [Dehalococcoidia bacterium]